MGNDFPKGLICREKGFLGLTLQFINFYTNSFDKYDLKLTPSP